MSVLEQASRHPSPDVREEAVRGLIAVGGASAVGRLQDLARDRDDRVRTLAVAGLGGLVGPEAIRALAEVAADSSEPGTRKEALDHLARHPSPEARTRLKELASGRGDLRLPRPARRYAKGLMKS
jgi:HEAT repeat protein